jgi:hypothetical protein
MSLFGLVAVIIDSYSIATYCGGLDWSCSNVVYLLLRHRLDAIAILFCIA